jgi:hypothetical protein
MPLRASSGSLCIAAAAIMGIRPVCNSGAARKNARLSSSEIVRTRSARRYTANSRLVKSHERS